MAEIAQNVDARSTPDAGPDRARRRRWKSVFLILFAFSPALLTGFHVCQNAVNIPTWDDWERGDLLQHYYEGTIDFEYLNSPHIDHRILFPRLMIIGLNELTGGDLRADIFVSYGIVMIGALALFLLIRRTLENRAWACLTTFLVNLILFSPLQYQNFLWAIQIAFLPPLACLAVILLTMTGRLSLWAKFFICLAAAVVGTHSFAHGLILWPVALCLALFSKEFAPIKQRLLFSGLFLLCAVAVVTFYFTWHFETTSHHGYGNEPGEATLGAARAGHAGENIDQIIRYALAALGSSFARLFHSDPLESARNTGRMAIFLFFSAVAWMWFQRKSDAWDRLLPWAAAGFYSITVAIVIGIGRHEINPERALLPRYVSNTMYIYIAIVVMAAFIFYHWRESAKSELARENRLRIALTLAVAWASLQLSQWVYGIHKMEAWKLARLQERVDLLYIKHFDPPYRFLGRIDHVLDFPKKHADYLDSKGLMTPALFEKPDFGSFEKAGRELPSSHAMLANARLISDTEIRFEGYATFDGAQDFAHGVLLTFREPGGEWRVFALADIRSLPTMRAMFLDKQFGQGQDFASIEWYARWTKTAPMRGLPDGKIEIMAWALDSENMRAHPMGRRLILDRSGDTPSLNFAP